MRIAEAIEAVALDRDRVLFWLEQIAAAPDAKTLIDVFVAKVVLMGDDDLHIVMHFDDGEGDEPPASAVLDRGGGVLPDCTRLHHTIKPAVRRAFLLILRFRQAPGK